MATAESASFNWRSRSVARMVSASAGWKSRNRSMNGSASSVGTLAAMSASMATSLRSRGDSACRRQKLQRGVEIVVLKVLHERRLTGLLVRRALVAEIGEGTLSGVVADERCVNLRPVDVAFIVERRA